MTNEINKPSASFCHNPKLQNEVEITLTCFDRDLSPLSLSLNSEQAGILGKA